jgi:hypothetical protein
LSISAYPSSTLQSAICNLQSAIASYRELQLGVHQVGDILGVVEDAHHGHAGALEAGDAGAQGRAGARVEGGGGLVQQQQAPPGPGWRSWA